MAVNIGQYLPKDRVSIVLGLVAAFLIAYSLFFLVRFSNPDPAALPSLQSGVWEQHRVDITNDLDKQGSIKIRANAENAYLQFITAPLPKGHYVFSVELKANVPQDIELFMWTTEARFRLEGKPASLDSQWQRLRMEFQLKKSGILGLQIGGGSRPITDNAITASAPKLTPSTSNYIRTLFYGILLALVSIKYLRQKIRTLFELPALKSVHRLRWQLLILLVFAGHLIFAATYKPAAPIYDSAENFSAAYNLAKHDVLTSSRTEDPSQMVQDWTREPLYPVALSILLPNFIDLDAAKLECFLAPADEECGPQLYSVFLLNIILVWITAVTASVATWQLTRSLGGVSITAALILLTPTILGDIPFANTELLAGMLLILHSLFLYQAFASHRPGFLQYCPALV